MKELCSQYVLLALISHKPGVGGGFYRLIHYELLDQCLLKLASLVTPLAAIYNARYGLGSYRDSSRMLSLQACRVLNIDLSRSIMVAHRLDCIQDRLFAVLAIASGFLLDLGTDDCPFVLNWHYQPSVDLDLKNRSIQEYAILKSLEQLFDPSRFGQPVGDLASL